MNKKLYIVPETKKEKRLMMSYSLCASNDGFDPTYDPEGPGGPGGGGDVGGGGVKSRNDEYGNIW